MSDKDPIDDRPDFKSSQEKEKKGEEDMPDEEAEEEVEEGKKEPDKEPEEGEEKETEESDCPLIDGKRAYKNKEWLKEQLEKGITQVDISRACNVSDGTISNWVLNKHKLREKTEKETKEKVEKETKEKTEKETEEKVEKETKEKTEKETEEKDEKETKEKTEKETEEKDEKEPGEKEKSKGFDFDSNWLIYLALGGFAIGGLIMYSKQKSKTEQVQNQAMERINEVEQERKMWQEKAKESQSEEKTTGPVSPDQLDNY